MPCLQRALLCRAARTTRLIQLRAVPPAQDTGGGGGWRLGVSGGTPYARRAELALTPVPTVEKNNPRSQVVPSGPLSRLFANSPSMQNIVFNARPSRAGGAAPFWTHSANKVKTDPTTAPPAHPAKHSLSPGAAQALALRHRAPPLSTESIPDRYLHTVIHHIPMLPGAPRHLTYAPGVLLRHGLPISLTFLGICSSSSPTVTGKRCGGPPPSTRSTHSWHSNVRKV